MFFVIAEYMIQQFNPTTAHGASNDAGSAHWALID
jgi:hypothetical protein